MQNKILLPKLKIIQNKQHNIQYNNSSPLISLTDSPMKHSKFGSTGHSKMSLQVKQRSSSLQPKLGSSFKKQYQSRSPQYFKKLERPSNSTLIGQEGKIMSGNANLDKIKEFDKIVLIKQSKQKLKDQNEANSRYSMKDVFEMKKINNKIKQTMTESNYSNFNVGTVPIVKSLKKIQPSHLIYKP